MALHTSKVTQKIFLLLASAVPVVFVSSTAVLAERVQIQPETIPVVPERLRDRIMIPNNQICGARTKAECEAWLRRIREAQEVRGVRIPQPQPDPSPELIRVSPNQINPQIGR